MARVTFFFLFFILSGLLFSLKKYNVEVENKSFSFSNYQKEYLAKLESLKESKKKIVKTVKPKKVALIDLHTEQLKNGHLLYTKTGKCATCHGKNGEGKVSQKAPKLAGQFEWYLYEQLVAMKNKVRVNAKMNPYLRKLEEKEFKDIAHYLSKLPKQ